MVAWREQRNPRCRGVRGDGPREACGRHGVAHLGSSTGQKLQPSERDADGRSEQVNACMLLLHMHEVGATYQAIKPMLTSQARWQMDVDSVHGDNDEEYEEDAEDVDQVRSQCCFNCGMQGRLAKGRRWRCSSDVDGYGSMEARQARTRLRQARSAPNVSYCVEAHFFRVSMLEEMFDSVVLLCELTR